MTRIGCIRRPGWLWRSNTFLHQTLSMSLHPIIEINELTQLVTDHLLTISPGSLVSLACTCRALKEQALSTLWSEQRSLKTLVEATSPSEIPSPSQPLPHVCTDDPYTNCLFADAFSPRGRDGTSSDSMRPGCAGSSSGHITPLQTRFFACYRSTYQTKFCVPGCRC